MRKFLKIFVIILVVGLVAGTSYALLQFRVIKQHIQDLTTRNSSLSSEKTQLSTDLNVSLQRSQAKEAQINTLKKELQGLQETKNIRKLYISNQKKLQALNAEFKSTSKENKKLKQESFTLNNRVSKLTNEFTKSLASLKNLQKALDNAKGDKTIIGYKNKIVKAEEQVKEKEEEVARLTQQLKDIQRENIQKEKKRKLLEKEISKLEKGRDRMQKQMQATKQKLTKRSGPDKKLEKQIQEMARELRARETQRRQLNNEVMTLKRSKIQVDQKIKYQDNRIVELEKELASGGSNMSIRKMVQEKNKVQEELVQAKDQVEKQKRIIALLEQGTGGISINELPVSGNGTAAELQGNLNKAYALYDTAKAQVVKFTELLMSKEVELEISKSKIAQLESELRKAREQVFPTGLNDAQQYSLWKDRIKILNESLEEKGKALNKNDEEIAALKMAKSTLEERISYQDNEFKDANTLYSNLKKQMYQTTELLSRREVDLMTKSQEILGLKSELALLQAEYKVKEQEVKEIEQRHRRTMDDLTRSTQMNITLQENMVDRANSSSVGNDDKNKADKLKKELELLLGQ